MGKSVGAETDIRGISEKEKGDYEDIGVPASRMVMCWWD